MYGTDALEKVIIILVLFPSFGFPGSEYIFPPFQWEKREIS